jgi:hypothetical protein
LTEIGLQLTRAKEFFAEGFAVELVRHRLGRFQPIIVAKLRAGNFPIVPKALTKQHRSSLDITSLEAVLTLSSSVNAVFPALRDKHVLAPIGKSMSHAQM